MSKQAKRRVLLSRVEIEATIHRLASEITRDYIDKNPVLIGILKGSFMFLADLVRLLDFPLEIDFIRASSYGKGSQTSGKVKIAQALHLSIKGRDVLVIDDIVDTGLTTSFLLEYLREKSPASLKLCSLMDKPSRRRASINIDYLGFVVPNKFVVGYGLDYDEKFRNVPDICVLEGED